MKIDKITKKKIKITTRQILLTFLDIGVEYYAIFDRHRLDRIPIKKYRRFRENDRLKFSQQLYQLKREGFIKRYFDGKKEFLEITNKGKEKLKKIITQELKISPPPKWDGKWRLVIFDIPDDKKDKRDMVRNKLEQLGFIKLQESVYVFPFDCHEQINRLKQMYFLEPYVLYIEADHIETEIDLIQTFYDENVLKDSQLNKRSNKRI